MALILTFFLNTCMRFLSQVTCSPCAICADVPAANNYSCQSHDMRRSGEGLNKEVNPVDEEMLLLRVSFKMRMGSSFLPDRIMREAVNNKPQLLDECSLQEVAGRLNFLANPHFRKQPFLRSSPVLLHRFCGHLQHPCDLLYAEPPQKTQFQNHGGPGIK